VLNEIAWSPGDPGTGAPSFLGIAAIGIPAGGLIPIIAPPLLRFSALLRTWELRPLGGGLEAAASGGRTMCDVRQ